MNFWAKLPLDDVDPCSICDWLNVVARENSNVSSNQWEVEPRSQGLSVWNFLAVTHRHIS